MFCDRCQDILNLDILLSTLRNFEPGGPKDESRPHHKNFADLVASAEAGCPICNLVCAHPHSSLYSHCSLLENGQIYFLLNNHDLLVFQFDISHEPERSLSRNSGILAIIRLSTNEGMCIRYKA